MVDRFEIIEFFAGRARVSKCAREAGLKAAALDVLYHENSRVLDMTSSAGFAYHACKLKSLSPACAIQMPLPSSLTRGCRCSSFWAASLAG